MSKNTRNVNLDAVDDGAESGNDKRGRDGILLELDVRNIHAELHDDKWGHDETYSRGSCIFARAKKVL